MCTLESKSLTRPSEHKLEKTDNCSLFDRTKLLYKSIYLLSASTSFICLAVTYLFFSFRQLINGAFFYQIFENHLLDFFIRFFYQIFLLDFSQKVNFQNSNSSILLRKSTKMYSKSQNFASLRLADSFIRFFYQIIFIRFFIRFLPKP